MNTRKEARLIQKVESDLHAYIKKETRLGRNVSVAELLLAFDRFARARTQFRRRHIDLKEYNRVIATRVFYAHHDQAHFKFADIHKETVVEPPFNAEYLLFLFLRKDDREVVVGDLVEEYRRLRQRFQKRRADIWFYKQVVGSLWPLLRRTLLKIGAFVWLGRMLRRFIS